MGKKYNKRSRITWRRPQNGNTYRSTQNDTKNNTKLENARPRWNTWFLVQEIHHYSLQTSTRNEQMLTRSTGTRLDAQTKDDIDPKGTKQRTTPNNYRPITCLPMMWKILTVNIREHIYYPLTSQGLFPDEQKGCSKGSRGTANLLYIDQHILNESKTRQKNLPMAWIN